MDERMRRQATVVAAGLALTLCAAVAVAWNAEAPAAHLLAPGPADAVRLAPAPPPDRPPVMPAPPPAPGPEQAAPAPTAVVTAFDACDSLLGWLRQTGERLVGPYGLPGTQSHLAVTPVAGSAAGGRAQDDAGAAEGASFEPAGSGTNVQEAGIDEPDMAKHDGGLVVALAAGAVQVVDVRATAPALRATLPLPPGWHHELLLRDGRLLVLSRTHDAPRDTGAHDGGGLRPASAGTPVTELTAYDLRDPAAPRRVGGTRLSGELVSAREHGGLVRLVLRSAPQLDLVAPAQPGGEAEQAALERNRELVRSAPLERWLPGVRAVSPEPAPGAAPGRPLAACDAVMRTGEPAGLDMLTIATFALAEPSSALGAVSVIGAGETVYATADRVYAAQAAPALPPVTAVHAFSTADPRDPRHLGSGVVPGMPLNQWALSEHDGHLRVATTRQAPDGSTESGVHVLAVGDGALREVGAVTGLGRGERIFAVRYLGATAFVVTFRQVDPLYTVDLSDPVRPRVVGELKIPGFSRYLHPVGDGLLLGIGRDADEQGVSRGLQVSVFDVSDLAAPKRVSQVTYGERSGSDAEHDHRAVLWWGPLRRLVVPLVEWSAGPEDAEAEESFLGVSSVAVDGSGRAWEAARLDTASADGGDGGDGRTAARRTFARGDSLLLVTDSGLLVAGLDRLERRAAVAFPAPAGH